MTENPFGGYEVVGIPYGDASEEWTDDELTVDRLMEDADSREEYDLDRTEEISLGLEISEMGMDGSKEALDGEEVMRYHFGDNEVYVMAHRDGLVIAGEEEVIRDNVFAEYLAPDQDRDLTFT